MVDLGHERHSELVGPADLIVAGGRFVLLLEVDAVEFVLYGPTLVTALPDLVPVLSSLSTRTSANDFEHVSGLSVSQRSTTHSVETLTLPGSHHHHTSWRHSARSSPEESSSSLQYSQSTQSYHPWRGRADDRIPGRGQHWAGGWYRGLLVRSWRVSAGRRRSPNCSDCRDHYRCVSTRYRV